MTAVASPVMRTGRTLVVAVAVLAAAVLSSCGVAADDRAATVFGQTVSVNTVDTLASDAVFLQALQAGEVGTDSVIPGVTARTVLTFEIQNVAARAELERFGLTLDDALLAEAEQTVRSQIPEQLSDVAVDRLAAFVGSTTALGNRLVSVDPASEQDLRLLYDGAPGLWDRTCVAMVAVLPAQSDQVEAVVAAGGRIEDVTATVAEAQLVFDPAEECVPTSQLPTQVRERITDAAPGTTLGPVVIEGQAGTVELFLRVDGTRRLAFDDPAAQEQLSGIAERLASAQQQPAQAAGYWLNLVLADAVQVNPRYGTAAVSQSGSFEVVAPAGPVTPSTLPPVLQDLPGAGGGTGASGSSGGGSGAPPADGRAVDPSGPAPADAGAGSAGTGPASSAPAAQPGAAPAAP